MSISVEVGLYYSIRSGSIAGIIDESPTVKEKTGEDKPVVNPLQKPIDRPTASSSVNISSKSNPLSVALIDSNMSQANKANAHDVHPSISRRRKLSLANVNVEIANPSNSLSGVVITNPLNQAYSTVTTDSPHSNDTNQEQIV